MVKKYALTEEAGKAINKLKEKAKSFFKKISHHYSDEEEILEHLDLETLDKAVNLKNQIDILDTQLKSLREKYNPLREEILLKLPGSEHDKVDAIVRGVQIKKYPQVRGAACLKEDKALELAKNKKILTKVTKQVRIIDHDMLLLAVEQGDITFDEYLNCLSEGSVSEVLKLERKFVIPNNDDSANKVIKLIQ
jgi:hypothetical protein